MSNRAGARAGENSARPRKRCSSRNEARSTCSGGPARGPPSARGRRRLARERAGAKRDADLLGAVRNRGRCGGARPRAGRAARTAGLSPRARAARSGGRVLLWQRGDLDLPAGTHARGEDRPAELFGLDLDAGTGKVSVCATPTERRDRSAAPPTPGSSRSCSPSRCAASVPIASGSRSRISPSASASRPRRRGRALLRASGVDPISIARATVQNIRKGAIAQGGSTITQQLVKNRDLTPKRTLGRKANEAVRALALETEYSKNEILESYLNTVYFGNVRGLAVHGIGAAARVYFSKPAQSLTLEEAASLAAMIQAPNRLSPIEHAAALRERARLGAVAAGRPRVGRRAGRRAGQGAAGSRQALSSPLLGSAPVRLVDRRAGRGREAVAGRGGPRLPGRDHARSLAPGPGGAGGRRPARRAARPVPQAAPGGPRRRAGGARRRAPAR